MSEEAAQQPVGSAREGPAAAGGLRRAVFLRNAGFLAAGELLERGIGLAIAVLLARSLGVAGYGAVGVAVSTLAFLGIAIRVGTTPLGIREVARHPQPAAIAALYGRIAGLRLVLASALLVLLVFGLGPLARSLGVPPALLGLYALGLLPLALAASWVFLGLERMHVVALGSLLERAVVLAALWLLVRGPDPDLLRVPLVEVGAAALATLGYLLLLRGRGLVLRPRPSRAGLGLLGEGVPVALAIALQTVYIQGDVMLLGWLSSTEAAGVFLASHKLVLTGSMVPTILQQAAFPATGRLLHRDRARAVALQSSILRGSLALVVPIGVLGSAAGPELLSLFYGAGFAEAAPVLRITLWTLPLVAIAGVQRALLLAAGASKPLLLGVATGCVAHVALALVLIPAAGAKGAAVACLLGEVLGVSTLVTLARLRLGRSALSPRALAPLAAGGLALLPLALPGVGLPARLALAAAVYGAAALALGVVRREEVSPLLAWARSAWREATGRRE